jgi:dipeptidyl-peptidase-4
MNGRLSALLLVAACAAPKAQQLPTDSPVRPAETAPPPAATMPAPAPATIGDITDADRQFLTDVVETRNFTLGKATAPKFLADGSKLLYLRAAGPRQPDLGLYVYDLATNETRELITPADVLKGAGEKLSPEEKARRERQRTSKLSGFAGFQISRDDTRVLVALSGRVYVVGLDGKSVVEVAGPDDKGAFPFDQRFSPDGRMVSFVRGGELWVAPAAGGKPRQLTKGAGGGIVHAQAEFVAQEELDRHTGYWWAPDSKSLVVQEHDESKVETLVPVDPAHPFDAGAPTRYPRPGTPNVTIKLGVVPAAGGKTVWLDWDRARYEYLVDVVWDDNAPLTLLVMSRDQKDVALLAADPKTGRTRQLHAEHDDAWVDLRTPAYRWLDDGSGFLWSSDRGGFPQLELRGADGALVRTLTPPELGFTSVAHVDRAGGTVIVGAAPEPVDARLYEVPLTGGEARLLSDEKLVTKAIYAERTRAHVRMRGSEQGELPAEVVRADGTVAGTLPEPFERVPFQAAPIVRKVGPGTGQAYWTATIKPRAFDAARTYPVLVKVYGGPGHTMVHRNAAMYLMDQWIADHGVIVVVVDGRGTPGRGRAWERAIKNDFAGGPLGDQVAGLQALAAVEPAMDLQRVGIYGWSFGGYMSALAVLRRGDVFKAAVAGAPVADWLDYDTAYTERYLGVPDRAGDTSVYDANGLIVYAAQLERPLLLVHGTADDNVLFSHTLELADALFTAGRPFEILPLAGETHSPRKPARMARYYEAMFRFFRNHL